MAVSRPIIPNKLVYRVLGFSDKSTWVAATLVSRSFREEAIRFLYNTVKLTLPEPVWREKRVVDLRILDIVAGSDEIGRCIKNLRVDLRDNRVGKEVSKSLLRMPNLTALEGYRASFVNVDSFLANVPLTLTSFAWLYFAQEEKTLFTDMLPRWQRLREINVRAEVLMSPEFWGLEHVDLVAPSIPEHSFPSLCAVHADSALGIEILKGHPDTISHLDVYLNYKRKPTLSTTTLLLPSLQYLRIHDMDWTLLFPQISLTALNLEFLFLPCNSTNFPPVGRLPRLKRWIFDMRMYGTHGKIVDENVAAFFNQFPAFPSLDVVVSSLHVEKYHITYQMWRYTSDGVCKYVENVHLDEPWFAREGH